MQYFKNMRRLGKVVAVLLGVLSLSAEPLTAAEAATPDFQQAIDLIKQNLPGISDKELDQAALLGLIKQLEPKVSLVPTNYTGATAATVAQGFKVSAIEGNLAWVRLTTIDAASAQNAGELLLAWQATNQLTGIIFDLRYATGDDYPAAAKLANLFYDSEKVLLKWGGEVAKATAKTNALKMPVSILVNRQTAAAAEALAAMLRQNHAGLLIGSRTAGQTADFKRFPLANGSQLRIATNLPRLDDDKELPINGLTPDIEVAVSPDDERTWFNDAYAVIGKPLAPRTGKSSASLTNRLSGRRLNEAELVRQQKENKNLGDAESAQAAIQEELPKHSIQDPALARAVDLLKGLAVVRRVARRD